MLCYARGRGEAAKSHREDGDMTNHNEIQIEVEYLRKHMKKMEGQTLRGTDLVSYGAMEQSLATLLLAKQVQRIADQIERWGQNGIFTRSE